MVLLNQVIQVLDLPEFDRFRKDSSNFELSNGLRIRCVFIDVDHAKCRAGGGGLPAPRLGRLEELNQQWYAVCFG